VVELAATRYSHLITRLFLREPVNAIVLGLLVVTTILCLLAAGTANDDAVGTTSQMGSGFTLVLVTASLLVLLPCIYFVFVTLSPISIIEWIRKDAVKVIKRVTSRKASPVQHRVLRSIEELQDISRGRTSLATELYAQENKTGSGSISDPDPSDDTTFSGTSHFVCRGQTV